MSLQCSRKYLQIKKLYCSEKFFTNIKYRKVVLILHLLKSWSLRPSDFAVNFIPHQDKMLPQWQLNRQQLLLWALHFGFQRFNNCREVVVTKAKRFCSLVQLVRSCNCRNGLGHWFRQGQCEPHILPWVGVCFIIVRSSAQSWLGPTRCKWNCSSMLN